MSLTLKSDPSRPGGGYAILRVEGAPVPAIAIEDRSSGLYLAPGGKWTKQPNYFDIEAINATSARLGPEIVDHVEADTILALHAAGAGALGILIWPAIRPSAGASSGYVIAEPTASNEVGITGEIPSVAAGASGATEAAVAAALAEPLPPPPPPPISETRPSFAAPAPAAKGSSLSKALLIANGLAVLIIALFLFRGTEAAKGLVCEPTGALHGVSFAHALVSCPEVAGVDPEQTAYNDYLQCLPGKAACVQISCSDTYLSGFTNGAHSVQVKAARTESQKSCQVDAQKKTAADDFSAFSECMRTTTNVCNRSQCVDRYRYKLTAEPYASNLRQAAETAANDCHRLQEESAFADFNRCVAGAAACDTARCASAFTSAFPSSAYVSRVLQTAENAARTCAAEHPVIQQQMPTPPTPQVSNAEQAARNFVARYYYASSSQGEAAGMRLSSIYGQEINFYGEQISNAEIMSKKIKYNAKWDTRRFALRDNSISVACNSSGQVCRATGQVEWDFYSSSVGRTSRGMSSFDLLIANSESNPKVIGESGKVEQRY
jgi:hypothetical protein